MAIRPPGSGDSTPEMILTRVDLPEPFSPTRQCTSPASSVRSTSRSACTPPKRFEMPDISSKGAKDWSCVGPAVRSDGSRGMGWAYRETHPADLLAANLRLLQPYSASRLYWITR